MKQEARIYFRRRSNRHQRRRQQQRLRGKAKRFRATGARSRTREVAIVVAGGLLIIAVLASRLLT